MLHLPSAELQFADDDGLPFAGGSLQMLAYGTSTPKNTWSDIGLTVLNPNPVPLDAAGRCVVWGEGAYRSILKDAAGNTIWDEPTFTYVSDAMEPVVGAATIAEARILLGIDDSGIAAEAAARAAADAAEQAARIAADKHLQDEIDAEIAARIAADDAIRATRSAAGNIRVGQVICGADPVPYPGAIGDGHGRIVFDPPFTDHVTAVVATATGQHAPGESVIVVSVPDLTGCDCYAGVAWTYDPATGYYRILGGTSSYVYFMAVGV